MQLGDMIQRELPLLADINPVRQVSQLFHDILYYDSLQPLRPHSRAAGGDEHRVPGHCGADVEEATL